MLKIHKSQITVRGGEHCGSLYGIFVCGAACAESSAQEYYAELLRRVPDNYIPIALFEHRYIFCELADVMIRHYDDYVENIWSKEQSKIAQYIPSIQKQFENSNFADKAEAAVGKKLPRPFFTATLSPL